MKNLTDILNRLSGKPPEPNEVPCRCARSGEDADPEWGQNTDGIEERCSNRGGSLIYRKIKDSCDGRNAKCKGTCTWKAKCYNAGSVGDDRMGPPEDHAPPIFVEEVTIKCIVL